MRIRSLTPINQLSIFQSFSREVNIVDFLSWYPWLTKSNLFTYLLPLFEILEMNLAFV